MKKIALIGCGNIAKLHGLCIQELGYELVGVASRTQASAKKYAANYILLRATVPVFAAWQSSLEKRRIDLVNEKITFQILEAGS